MGSLSEVQRGSLHAPSLGPVETLARPFTRQTRSGYVFVQGLDRGATTRQSDPSRLGSGCGRCRGRGYSTSGGEHSCNVRGCCTAAETDTLCPCALQVRLVVNRLFQQPELRPRIEQFALDHLHMLEAPAPDGEGVSGNVPPPAGAKEPDTATPGTDTAAADAAVGDDTLEGSKAHADVPVASEGATTFEHAGGPCMSMFVMFGSRMRVMLF